VGRHYTLRLAVSRFKGRRSLVVLASLQHRYYSEAENSDE